MPIKKILIVDDSPTERHALSEMLAKSGYTIVTAESGEEAIAKSKSEMPDLVLMDVVMPGMNGYQATRRLAQDPATASIPILIISTKTQEADRVWGLRQGAVQYLTKPVSEQELVAAVRAALG